VHYKLLTLFTLIDCSETYLRGYKNNGIYLLWLQQGYRFGLFYCDMDTMSELTNKRGWAVFQKRFNGVVNFDRKWNEYSKGFGTLNGEHWAGLENIFSMTRQLYSVSKFKQIPPPRLRIDFEDWDGLQLYTEIDEFVVKGAEDQYRISVLGSAYGSATYIESNRASMTSGNVFSTVDNDNTYRKCPTRHNGGWWFPRECGASNLNGHYSKRYSYMDFHHMFWHAWPLIMGRRTALRRVSMKIQY